MTIDWLRCATLQFGSPSKAGGGLHWRIRDRRFPKLRLISGITAWYLYHNCVHTYIIAIREFYSHNTYTMIGSNELHISPQTVFIEILSFSPSKSHSLYVSPRLSFLKKQQVLTHPSDLSYASTMSTILPQSLSSFFNLPRYTRLASSDSATEGNTTKFHFWQILSSKRARELALILFIFLLLAWTSTWLTNTGPIAKSFASGSITATCQNGTVNGSLKESVDWSRFAYVQYATNPDYLCNSVMVFEILHRLNSKADRLLMYPSDYELDEDPETESSNSRLLRKARDRYDVKLKAIAVQRRNSADGKFGRRTIADMDTVADDNISNVGGKLHKAPCFQPNPIWSSSPPRFGLDSTPSTLILPKAPHLSFSLTDVWTNRRWTNSSSYLQHPWQCHERTGSVSMVVFWVHKLCFYNHPNSNLDESSSTSRLLRQMITTWRLWTLYIKTAP